MSATRTANIQSLLRRGVRSVWSSDKYYAPQWSEIYDTHPSDQETEIEVEMKLLGLAQVRAEGAPSAVDTMSQKIITLYTHKYVSLMFEITRQARMDNLYKSQFPHEVLSLKNSMQQTKEVLGASLLNNALNAANPIGDGQPMLSTAHPIEKGYYANTLSIQADLTEGSLESMIILIQQFKDQAGLITRHVPQKLVVPPQNQFVAERLLGSAFRTNTSMNDISAIYNLSSIPQGYRVNQFLTLPRSWFILTSAKGMNHYVRESLETSVYTDMDTDNYKVKALERYSFGCGNPRAIAGCAAV
jgi:hypothetical protein